MRTLALLVLLPLAACGDSGTPDLDPAAPGPDEAAERTVQTHFEDTFGVQVASVACERTVSTPSAEIGAVVAVQPCTVEQTGGDAFVAEVTTTLIALPDGEPTEAMTVAARGTLFVSAVEEAVAASISEQAGMPVEARCEAPRAVLSTPGDRFGCRISNGTEQRVALVTITSQSGDIDFVVAD